MADAQPRVGSAMWGGLNPFGDQDGQVDASEEPLPAAPVVVREVLAAILLVAAVALTAVGAGLAWGLGVGLFTAGVGVLLIAVLLGLDR